MRWIVGWATKSHRAVIVGAAVLMAFGMWQLHYAKVDALPEFSQPTVEVQTAALGLSAEEVEQLITVPIEQDLLAGVAWLHTIRSHSTPGLSSVELVFEPGTDLYRARQVVQERISQAAGLPNVSKPPQMLDPRSSTSRTMMISLSSTKLSALEIGVLTRWTIRPRLLAVRGVSNVAIWGQRERQLQVQVDPKKLLAKNVTLSKVISSTGNALWVSPLTFLEASSPGTGGFIDTPQQRIGIQHNLPIVKPADLANIPLDETEGAPLTLGDVATVVEDHQPLIGDAVVNDRDGGGFMLVVEKLPNANTSDVTKAVEAALADLGPAVAGLDIDASVFRAAGYVDESVDNLTRSLLIGAALMVLMLAALLFGWRTTVISVVAIVLSFVVAALVFKGLDRTVNLVVFAGLMIALGAIVDDAVVNVETIRQRTRGRGTTADDAAPSAVTVISEATLETGRTVVWATVMFALALTPIFLMDGLAGDFFFPPLAAAGLLAMVASLLVALTVTPALSLLLGSERSRGRTSPLARLHRGYDKVLPAVVRSPIPAFAAIGALLVASALVLPGFEKSLLPELKDRNLLIQWNTAFGTSLPEMDRITARASAELRTVPGVRNVGAHVGQALLGDQPVGSESAQMWLSLDPSAGNDKTIDAVQDVLDGYPGVSHEILTYSTEKLRQILGRSNHEITVRIFGQDLDVLHDKADEVKALLAGTKGVHGANVVARQTEPTIEIEVDLAEAEDAGIKPGDVRRGAATLLSGLRVGSLFQDQKVFDVVVWSVPEARHSVSSVQDLLINTPAGDLVRLGDVADVRVRATSPSIEHEDISRFVDVTADVSGRGVDNVERDVRDGLAQIAFPFEYHAQLLSDYSDHRNAERHLLGYAIAAAIGVFLLLQTMFGSWRLAIIVFGTLPVALSGGVLAAWIDGGPKTLATAAGVLAVLALAIRNSVMLVTRFQRLRNDGLPFGRELMQRGAGDRLAPMVMTVLTTVAVVLPAIAFGDIAGQEVLHPLAIVMVGGLITTTLVNLFFIPALYLRYGPREAHEPLDLDSELQQLEQVVAGGAIGSADHDGGN